MIKKLVPFYCLLLSSYFLIGGCAGTGTDVAKDVRTNVEKALPYLRPAAALLCTNTLAFAVNDAERAVAANYIYAVAHGIRTLTGGRVPTPEEVKATVELFSPGQSSKWVTLGTSIQAIYGGIFVQIKGDPALALQALEAIASGCEDAANVYRTPTP